MPDRPNGDGRAQHPSEPHVTHHRTRAQERIDALETSPAKLLAELEAAKADLEQARAQAEEYLAALQRERAEFTNFRRRTAEQREQELGLAGEDLIRKVLGLADDFDRAIEARPAELADSPWAEGIAAIDRKLRQLLESEGVTQVDAHAGRPFDPREHEAIANMPGTGHPEGVIVDEVRRGYRLRDRVLRPALVVVAAPAEPGTGPSTGAQPPDHPDNPTTDRQE